MTFRTVTRHLVDGLGLAATPVFALMALATAVAEHNAPDAFCSVMRGSSITGMAAMYLLMSAFHISPWLKLIAGRTPDAAAS